MKNWEMALQLFWHRMFSQHDDELLRRLECEYSDHHWSDVHRAVTPDHWVVAHQLCSRCGETRPPPAEDR